MSLLKESQHSLRYGDEDDGFSNSGQGNRQNSFRSIAGPRRSTSKENSSEIDTSRPNVREDIAAFKRVASQNTPVLGLVSLDGTFERKRIPLPYFPDGVKFGRQKNFKTVPTRRNGFFDAKVVSRSHAVIWASKTEDYGSATRSRRTVHM